MGTVLAFRTEKNGYEKEQVDLYIKKLSEAYQQVTETNKSLRAEVEELKQEQQPAPESEQEEGYARLEMQEYLNLTAAYEGFQEQLAEKDKELEALREEREQLKKEAQDAARQRQREEEDYNDVIGQAIIEAKRFAQQLKDQARQEIDQMRYEGNKELQQYKIAQRQVVDDLKKLQGMIYEVTQQAESSLQE
ncbi:MAG: hypothetical protein LIO46_01580 [Clostridiales bacterium]|nr:hypothetical protein [Clostridiales bacterium]